MPIGEHRFLAELRRRRIFHVAAVYTVAAWIVVQVASEVFPAINVPASTIRYVWIALILGFPVALVFGWRFDIVHGRITHTPTTETSPETGLPLQRADYFVLTALFLVTGIIVYGLVKEVVLTQATPVTSEPAAGALARSIAVLPFENISKIEENASFTVGIHDDLLTQLAKISTLKVISRTSVLQYRETTKTAPAIAAELGVASILEGGVQRYGDKVRINVQLVDAQSDKHLWAETYDRDLTARNVYAIQTEIAESITSALHSTLTSEDHDRLEKVPTESLDAYYAYLLGKQRMINRTSASLRQAADYFQRAVELDPDYALAYVGLADAYMMLGDYGNLSLREMLSLALPALQTALRLDDRLPEAYASKGAIISKSGDYATAEAAYKRAIELDPNYATAHHWYADLLVTYQRRPDAALPLLQRALELDPLSPAINITLGQAFENLGRFDEAMAQYLRTNEIEPSYPSPYFLIAGLHRSAYGQLDEALRWRFKGMAQDPGMVFGLSGTGLYFLDLGDETQAEYWIDRALALAPGQAAPNRALVYLYRYRNDRERALQAARRLQEIAPGDNTSLVTLVSFGNYREALDEFAGSYPELSCEDEPSVTRSNFFQALNLSLALEKTGERECATMLLNKVHERLQTLPRLGSAGYGIADVEVYARLGNREEAIAALRRAIDGRYRAFWWAQGEKSPHTLSLHEDPEFVALMQKIKADMALQLARVRDMRASGEMPDIPPPEN